MGRLDPFAAPFGYDRYLRIPAEDQSRRRVESFAASSGNDRSLRWALPSAGASPRTPRTPAAGLRAG